MGYMSCKMKNTCEKYWAGTFTQTIHLTTV